MEIHNKYYAFISYKSEDVEWATWLQHELEHYHLPASFNGRTDMPQELRPVFRDVDELSAGNLPKQIKQALNNSQNLIVICSPLAATSPWVNQEVETFISLGRTDKIFPFIVEGKSPAEFFPPALLNLPKNEERLGGDVSKKGRDAAFVKVVAGMLGISFDTLWQRYEREKAEEERKIKEQRDNLLRVQNRYIAEKAHLLVDKGDSYTARRLLLEVLPDNIEKPNRPYTIEGVLSFCYASQHNSTILIGHTSEVYFATFFPDGKRIISASKDKTIRIWDAETGKETNKLEGHTGPVRSIAFSPNGKLIISASDDNTIRIWDAETGKEMKKLKGCYPATFSPDGKRIAAGSRVLDAQTGKELFFLGGEYGIFSPDGKGIFTACPYYAFEQCAYRNTFKLWDAETGKELMSFGDIGDVSSVAFSPCGNRIIATGADNSLRVWDIQTGKELMKLVAYPWDYKYASFSPDGKLIVSASRDNTVCIWDTETGEQISKFEGHTSYVYSAVFSPDGKRIASASFDNTIRIWDARPNPELMILEGHIRIKHVTFSPDSNLIASATLGDNIRIWDVNTGKMIIKLDGGYGYASFSPDGKRIVDGKGVVFDAQTGRVIMKLHGRGYASFSPDGKLVALEYDNEWVIGIWDVESGVLINKLKGHEWYVNYTDFSPDGKLIISASDDKTIRIWDVKSGKELAKLEGHLKEVRTATFSPDGKLIISASDDKTIRIWDTDTGLETMKIEVQTPYSYVASAFFSPDGKRIVSSDDCVVRIWDAETGLELANLKGHTNFIDFAIFSPNGKYIASASRDHTVRIWDAPPLQDLINRARDRFKNYPLTSEERKKYYLD